MSSPWSDYDHWNMALAQRLFGTHKGDQPAYIDVDPEVLADCAKAMGLDGSLDPWGSLVEAVRPTLQMDSNPFLADHTRRLLQWRRRVPKSGVTRRSTQTHDLPPPPVIALLCTLVMAAEKMGSDSTLAPHAYYPRLAEVLGLDAKAFARLKAKFPITEMYWRALNEYLEAHDGYFGLPTAYALGFRYVGIPQSQALVRATDRSRLPQFFHLFGLAPGSELIASDLERLLDAWITATPSPVSANLVQLWRGGKARERVAGVVAVELALWDGSLARSGVAAGTTAGDLQLTALLRQQFGSRSLELSFAARLPMPVDAASLRINSAEGSPEIGVVPAAGGRLRPSPASRLDGASLIGASLELEETTSSQKVGRLPRRVVPLRKDELLGVLVEADRVQLADDAVLLVRDEGRLLESVLEVVDAYGHRGKTYGPTAGPERDAMKGVPEGWVLIDDVQFYAIPQGVTKLDLHALIPVTTAQLNFSGGLKLPGRLKKWSSLHPPEMRAAVAEADEMSISLAELGDERVLLHSWSEPTSAMAVPLGGLELRDGDYEIELSVNGEIISRSTLRLRSADTPDVVTWETCARLNYELDRNQLASLSATDLSGESEVYVDGLNTIGEWPEEIRIVPARLGASWSTNKKSSGVEQPVVVLGTTDPKSCVATGAHYIELPTFHGGRQGQRQITGVCRMCGLRKVLPARPKWKGAPEDKPVLKPLNFTEFPSHNDLEVGWNQCLDALVHVGGGSIGALERVAAQAEGSSLFMDQFLRAMEGFGHLDVRRDGAMQPRDWEANPAYIAETTRNGFVLAGVWSTGMRAALATSLEQVGGELAYVGAESGELSSWFVRGVTADQIEEAILSLGLEAGVVPEAPQRMLRALPPLSLVETGMAPIPMPSYSKATRFDLSDAAWVKVPGIAGPGAYRIEQSFKTVNLWVDHSGAIDRTARIGSVQLVKHLAARAANAPLLGYLEDSQMLVVPLGADLPGLYGRVATACSGRPPVVSRKTRSLGYRDVPRAIADGLNSLLIS